MGELSVLARLQKDGRIHREGLTARVMGFFKLENFTFIMKEAGA